MERPAFSDMLSIRRRELGYSIRQAARVLRLREDVLVAFEEGDFEAMPKSGYAQGMLSSYARYLGLDPVEVVGAFTRDYERYSREMRHRRRDVEKSPTGISSARSQHGERVGQPYVRSRGLLPTSGGPAGDLGTFSTTRVRPRYAEYLDEEEGDAPVESLASTGYERETHPEARQGRPYTARTPHVTSPNSARGDTQVRWQDVREFDYADDLTLNNEARRFEAASSVGGRRDSRHISDASRQRMRGGSARRGSADRRRQAPSRASSPLSGNTIVLVVAVLVVIAISVVLIVSVTSCVAQGTERRTVPVSAAIEAEQQEQQDASAREATEVATSGDEVSDAGPAQGVLTQDTGSSASSADVSETSVSVSVASGAVTWLEVECDGVSDVAETITGPWQRTYTVEDEIQIQAGNTQDVSVVQNGRQVQFDSVTSGIGTLRIEGTKRPATKQEIASAGTQNKIGDAREDAEAAAAAAAAGVAADEATGLGADDASAASEESGYDDSYDYDYGYGYDDYGYDDYYDYGYDDYGYDEWY